jgi:hypothetical protein
VGRALRAGVAAALVVGALVYAGFALGAASFADSSGDDNAAPDVTSVAVSEAADGMLTVALSVANHPTLPGNSWFNLWFDLDSNQQTGDAGDEALIRYNANGVLDFYLWSGGELVERPATGITGTYAGGVLTVTAPESLFGGLTSFGFLAVSARGQELGDSELIASDYAPDVGRSAYAGPALVSFPDPRSDHDAAPDITSVRVTDAKNGWINFAISTPNYATLPVQSFLFLEIDSDSNPRTGDQGADLLVTAIAGEVQLERWSPRAEEWVEDNRPTRVTMRNAGKVVTIAVHRSELGSAPRFGFAVATVDFNVEAEEFLAIDFAPDDDSFYRYTMVNKAALVLTKTRVVATPAQPRAGKPFAVNLGVRRSDTNRGITSGAVTCRVLLAGKPLRARGSVVGGAARCSVTLPASARGARLSGTVAVRVAGKSVSAAFSYVVR